MGVCCRCRHIAYKKGAYEYAGGLFERTIERWAAQPVLYMRRTGAYGLENYALMRRFKDWLWANGLFTEEAVLLAVPLDDPAATQA